MEIKLDTDGWCGKKIRSYGVFLPVSLEIKKGNIIALRATQYGDPVGLYVPDYETQPLFSNCFGVAGESVSTMDGVRRWLNVIYEGKVKFDWLKQNNPQINWGALAPADGQDYRHIWSAMPLNLINSYSATLRNKPNSCNIDLM